MEWNGGDGEKVKIPVEIEIDAHKAGVNRYQKIIDLARAFDSWRIFPRVFIVTYILLLYDAVHWFMALEQPSAEQAGLISVVTGIGAAWFGLYLSSGGKSE